MKQNTMLDIVQNALVYYACGGHIQYDSLGVADQPYVEPGHRAADALAALNNWSKLHDDDVHKTSLNNNQSSCLSINRSRFDSWLMTNGYEVERTDLGEYRSEKTEFAWKAFLEITSSN